MLNKDSLLRLFKNLEGELLEFEEYWNEEFSKVIDEEGENVRASNLWKGHHNNHCHIVIIMETVNIWKNLIFRKKMHPLVSIKQQRRVEEVIFSVDLLLPVLKLNSY